MFGIKEKCTPETSALFPGQREEEAEAVAPGARLARVAVERGIDSPAGDGLTYLIPPAVEHDGPVRVGQWARVPLGKRNAPIPGIVVAVGGPELAAGFKGPIKSIVDRLGPGLPDPLVQLGRWISEYYICPLGMTLAAMMPAAVKKAVGKRIISKLQPTAPDRLGELAEVRLKPTVQAAWIACQNLPPAAWPIAPKTLALQLGLKSVAALNRLVDAGFLVRVETPEVRAVSPAWEEFNVEALSPPTVLMLTPAQDHVVSGIAGSLGGFAVHLIRGVTGSGKTEVYIRLIEQVLARGQRAIVLVPEISLTPQTAGRFRSRFLHAGVAILHSGLTAAQRHREWARVAAGEVGVIVGARSAVFAPVDRLGVIIVDEEHDSSGYKQDQMPRYHGRDVAVKRGQIENCPVVLGSATPSLESWANATGENPRYRLWELTDRVGGGTLPKVEVVDLAAERRTRAARGDKAWHLLGPRLEIALAEILRAGGQAILLLNRRGYGNRISCTSAPCGWTMGCEYCDSLMVMHRGEHLPLGSLVRCHHCLAEQRTPTRCPLCNTRVRILGTGTQRLEDELGAKFPDLPLGPFPGTGETAAGLVEGRTMRRVDSDTMGSGRDYFQVLAAFASGRIRLLLGTQLIAKGLDYPNVRLVGVVDADTALTLPDFRASERTFQLVSQVAGRTGRSTAGGRVIVQTWSPPTPAIRLAAAHDFPGFAAGELADRRRAGLPPIARMARVVVRNHDARKAAEEAEVIAAHLRAAGEGLKIEGPMPPPIERLAGYYRMAIEITAPSARRLLAILTAVRDKGLLKSDARTAVDVDPASLM